MSSRQLFLFIAIFSLAFFSCKKNSVESSEKSILANQASENANIATRWADMTLFILRHGVRNSPTYSSRSLAYMGLTMYEAVVNADATRRSMKGQLPAFATLPTPETGSNYYWPLALNAGQATMLKLLYPVPVNLSQELKTKIDSLYNLILSEKSNNLSVPVVDRSVKFGEDLAKAIFEWSKTDGGYEGFLRHFDPAFVFPTGAGYWRPPIVGQTVSRFPLHPYWGQNRTFSAVNAGLPTPALVPYSTNANSDYYKLYDAVYKKNLTLTNEDKQIAAWWADDPTETFSPPGHSYYLATIAIKKAKPTIVKAAETYARVGMVVADAFICCWKTKMVYFNERPSTYVRANIAANWVQFWPEPPFPAFPSGHATQSAAAATVLTSLYGNNFSFTDNSHDGAMRLFYPVALKSRNFNSFWETAVESAYSRFVGGIHTQQDNEIGLTEGKKIGENINALSWNK